MILQCPACQARFLVADAQVPPAGRTVRCGRCAHEWHAVHEAPSTAIAEAVPLADPALDSTSTTTDAAALPPISEPPDSIAPLMPGANLPAIAKPPRSAKPYQLAAAALAVTWAVLALLTYFPRGVELPVISGLYRAIGASPTEGLMFADLSMEKQIDDVKTRYILAGSIRNESAVTREVPTVRVRLEDASGNRLWGREYPVRKTLKPGEVYPFRITNVETSFAGSVRMIVVDMGHPLQLLVR